MELNQPEEAVAVQLSIARLDERDFASMSRCWEELLRNTLADPLFMSWAWLYSWWDTWGASLGLELVLLGAYDQTGALRGIAPLYRHRYRTPIGFSIDRLHFIGNAWHIAPTVRTEYVGFIADRDLEQQVVDHFIAYLSRNRWDEIVISDALMPQLKRIQTGFATHERAVTPVVRRREKGVHVPTTGSFQAWCGGLGKNTRLKTINRRSIFENQLGGSHSESSADEADRVSFLQTLNEFHGLRWGKPCFDRLAIRFHLGLMSRLQTGQRLRLSRLKCRGKTLSVLYDIQAGSRVYNIQAGFIERFHKKLSLGTLHIGYAIEAAFRAPEVMAYDLLAGSGKHTFYKARFNGQAEDFLTVQYVRKPGLKFVYYCRTKLPQTTVRWLNKPFRL